MLRTLTPGRSGLSSASPALSGSNMDTGSGALHGLTGIWATPQQHAWAVQQ